MSPINIRTKINEILKDTCHFATLEVLHQSVTSQQGLPLFSSKKCVTWQKKNFILWKSWQSLSTSFIQYFGQVTFFSQVTRSWPNHAFSSSDASRQIDVFMAKWRFLVQVTLQRVKMTLFWPNDASFDQIVFYLCLFYVNYFLNELNVSRNGLVTKGNFSRVCFVISDIQKVSFRQVLSNPSLFRALTSLQTFLKEKLR